MAIYRRKGVINLYSNKETLQEFNIHVPKTKKYKSLSDINYINVMDKDALHRKHEPRIKINYSDDKEIDYPIDTKKGQVRMHKIKGPRVTEYDKLAQGFTNYAKNELDDFVEGDTIPKREKLQSKFDEYLELDKSLKKEYVENGEG